MIDRDDKSLEKIEGEKTSHVINIKNISKIREQNKEAGNKIKSSVLIMFNKNKHTASRKFANKAHMNAATRLMFKWNTVILLTLEN